MLVNAGFDPVAGLPLFCQVPSLEKYNFPLSKSKATPIIGFPEFQEFP